MAGVIVKGLDELNTALNNFVFDMAKATEDAVKVTALQVRTNAIKRIKEPSQGRTVTRSPSGQAPYKHTSSKEGEAPNTDTGRLMDSIDIEHSKGDDFAFVHANTDYALYLETVLDRPFLEPALEEEKKGFSSRVSDALDTQIKKAGK